MFYYTYLNLNYFTSASMLVYTRNFLFSLQNCWKLTSKNLGHGLMHRPLSRQVWLTLKNINLLVSMRGQRGRNHLRRPNDKSINVTTRVERQQNLPEKRRSANQIWDVERRRERYKTIDLIKEYNHLTWECNHLPTFPPSSLETKRENLNFVLSFVELVNLRVRIISILRQL